jgi:hypothetical protein
MTYRATKLRQSWFPVAGKSAKGGATLIETAPGVSTDRVVASSEAPLLFSEHTVDADTTSS